MFIFTLFHDLVNHWEKDIVLQDKTFHPIFIFNKLIEKLPQ